MKNKVMVCDNGAGFCVTVNGLIVDSFSTLAGAWNRIAWMYRVASQDFVVGKKEIPSKEWVEGAIKMGFIEEEAGFKK